MSKAELIETVLAGVTRVNVAKTKCDKIPYETPADARRQLFYQKRRHRYRMAGRYNVYFCQECKAYHFGSRGE